MSHKKYSFSFSFFSFLINLKSYPFSRQTLIFDIIYQRAYNITVSIIMRISCVYMCVYECFLLVITAPDLHSASIYPPSLLPLYATFLRPLSTRTCQIYFSHSFCPLSHSRGIKYPRAHNEKDRMYREREKREKRRIERGDKARMRIEDS